MKQTIDLLAVGNPCVDLVIHALRVPAWDDKCIGSAAGTYAGGTEANVACAASRLGLVTAVFGDVGDDGHGRFLIDEFKPFGVRTEWVVRRAGMASATTVILVSPQGERSVVWVPMPARTGMREGLALALQRSRIAYTMPYDEGELAVLAQAAHASGGQVAIDVEREAAGTNGALQRLLQHCDVAFINEGGFVAALGCAPSVEGLQALFAAGKAHTLVVTLGAHGAMAIDATGVARQRAFATEVVDTTGAGDSFNAAFIAARMHGRRLQEALAFGCAAASRSVAVLGARGGLPARAEVEALLHTSDTEASR